MVYNHVDDDDRREIVFQLTLDPTRSTMWNEGSVEHATTKIATQFEKTNWNPKAKKKKTTATADEHVPELNPNHETNTNDETIR